MKKWTKISSFSLFLLLSAFFALSFSLKVEASTIQEQPNVYYTFGFNNYGDLGTQGVLLQPIGTGYTATAGAIQMDWYIGNPSTTVRLLECPNSNPNSSGCSVVATTGSFVSMSDGSFMNPTQASFTVPYVMNPSKYYQLAINAGSNGDTNTFRIQAGNTVDQTPMSGFNACDDSTCTGGTTGQSVYFILSTGVAPPNSPTVNFIYPTNGTTVAPFSNFIFTYTNLIATHTYQTSVSYFIPQVSNTITGNNTVNGGQLTSFGNAIQKQPFNIITQIATTSIVANVTLYDITNFAIPDNLDNYVVATSGIVFTQYSNNGNGTTTYNYVTPFTVSGTVTYAINQTINPSAIFSASSTGICTIAQATGTLGFLGSAVGYGICNAFQTMFVPNSNVTAYLQNSINAYQSIFPFNLYFGIVGGFQDAITVNNVSTTQTLPLTVEGLNGNNYTVITINSSTLTNALTVASQTTVFGTQQSCSTTCAQEKISNVNGIADMLIWMTTGLKIVSMIIAF